MIDSVLNFEFNSTLGVFLYWIPLSFCVYGYTVRTFVNYQDDVANRELSDQKNSTYGYYPTETIGSLIGRAIMTIVPLLNIWGAVFDLAPETFGRFFDFLRKVFNQPLVKKRAKPDV